MRSRRFLTTALAFTTVLAFDDALRAIGTPAAFGDPAAKALVRPAPGGQHPPRAGTTIVRVSDPGGFDWADAGVGAAGGVALSALGAGLALLISQHSVSTSRSRTSIRKGEERC
jgi:hypothetical protein